MADRGTSVRPRIATAVLVLGFAAAAVLPVLLCVRGWHDAEAIRGIGAGRGVFTVAACGDRRETTSITGDGTTDTKVAYTCAGTFSRSSAAPVDAAVTSSSNYHAGVSRSAYITGGGHVHLASGNRAAGRMATWFTAACLLAAAELTAVWLLSRWIRGRMPEDLVDILDSSWKSVPLVSLVGLSVLVPLVGIFWVLACLLWLIVFAF